MAKTLVTLGYHYGELGWGREVREAYEARGLQEGRDITFYEVANSTVETGDPCPEALEEILGVMKGGGFDVRIDIHCGYCEPGKERTVLAYRGTDDSLLSRARSLPGVLVNDLRNIPEPLEKRVYDCSALADPFLLEADFSGKTMRYRHALDRTLEFINQVYDIHLPEDTLAQEISVADAAF